MARILVELHCPRCGMVVGTGWVNEDSPAPVTGPLCAKCRAAMEAEAENARDKAEEGMVEGDGCIEVLVVMLVPLVIAIVALWKG